MPTYPLTLPASPKAREITWRQSSRVAVGTSPITGKQQVYAHPGQWWEFTLDLPPLTDAEANAWAAVLLALNGPEGTFYFTPTDAGTQGAVSGTHTVDEHSGYSIGFTGGTGTFTAGDWIQLASGLYRVTSGGGSSIEVWPAARADIVDSTTTAVYSAPKGIFRLFDPIEWDMDVARRYGITIAAREAL